MNEECFSFISENVLETTPEVRISLCYESMLENLGKDIFLYIYPRHVNTVLAIEGSS